MSALIAVLAVVVLGGSGSLVARLEHTCWPRGFDPVKAGAVSVR